jgi:heme exporter protein C
MGKRDWWKLITILLVFYVLVAGFLIDVPRLAILNETIRNLFFHVALWFAMFILLIVSLSGAVGYLRTNRLEYDYRSIEFANAGILFGILGVVTGSVWARYTWGDWWVNDPKLNATAIAIMIYLAYFVLRASLDDPYQRARISAVYNVFAFAAMIPLIFVLPRLTDSLHPGNGGNPGFSAYDLDSTLRWVFYPSVFAWALTGTWMAAVRMRMRRVEEYFNDQHT